jgi:predicted nucleotidyltransferase
MAGPEADALAFAQVLAGSCIRVIEASVAGVILHGSLTLGAYVPGRSDADLLMVVDDRSG